MSYATDPENYMDGPAPMFAFKYDFIKSSLLFWSKHYRPTYDCRVK